MAREAKFQHDRPGTSGFNLELDGFHAPNEGQILNGKRASSHNTPSPTQRGGGPFPIARSPIVNPSSTLLQNLINEQRASRSARTTASSVSHVVDSEIHAQTANPNSQSEESSSEKQRKLINAFSYVSKLNKQTFDLKLEIFHRAQQISILERKLERLPILEEQVRQSNRLQNELQELREVDEENRRLRQSNAQLRLEMDKRDQAVSEAVELICRLETKVDELKSRKEEERPSTARPYTTDHFQDSPNASPQTLTPKNKIIFDVPDRTSSRRGTRTSNSRSTKSRTATPTLSSPRPRRYPSFLQEQSSDTHALRNVYPTDFIHLREASSFSSRNGTASSTGDTLEPESPRLSALSECSYLDPALSPTKSFLRDDPNISGQSKATVPQTDSLGRCIESPNLQNSNLSRVIIEEWMEPNRELDRGLKPNPRPSPNSAKNSLADPCALAPAFQARRPTKTCQIDLPSNERCQFNNSRFPPTPDTMSTSILESRNKSNSSVVAERSRYDRAATCRPISIDRALGRRRSADEITTRPSTADTILSDGIDTWSNVPQFAFDREKKYQLASMFPPFKYDQRPASEVLDTGAGIGLPGLSLVSTIDRNTIPNHTPRIQAHGIRHTDHASLSTSPPLTPQDWLEAALPQAAPTSKKEVIRSKDSLSVSMQHATGRDIKLPVDESPGTTPDEVSYPDPRFPNSTLRSRRARILADLQSRRSFRPLFFNRLSTVATRQPPTSGEAENNTVSTVESSILQISAARSSAEPRTNGTATATNKQPNESHPINDSPRNSTLRPHQTMPNISTATSGRSSTVDGVEHKRRSSHGFFGWMKGAGGGGGGSGIPTKPADQAIASIRPITPQEANVGKESGAPRPGGASSTSIAPGLSAIAVDATVSSVSPENMDRPPRLSYKASRKA
ncbi:hypothetical protein FQN57_002276 [Myotisia sp. PD_48]|nr:hypothetical protein FQN57_002276 [Myotisia sp. PD_48]